MTARIPLPEAMTEIIVDLHISADEYLKQYLISGAVVVTRSRDGRSVRFPASILQRFVGHGGVQGSFRIEFDRAGKFVSVNRLA